MIYPVFRCGPCRGFTLVEMLAVMGIVVVLLALVVPALTSLNKSNSLNNAGSLFINLLSVARTEAITRRTVVRVEVATTWPDPAYDYRKATLTAATLNQDGTAYQYSQIGKWETIPDGIVFDPNDPLQGATPTDGSLYLLPATSSMPPGDQGSLTFAGTNVQTAFIAFTPTGALVENVLPSSGLTVPIRARLVEGVLNGPTAVTYTHRVPGSSNNAPANWLDVRVNNLVGRIEVGRPESPLP